MDDKLDRLANHIEQLLMHTLGLTGEARTQFVEEVANHDATKGERLRACLEQMTLVEEGNGSHTAEPEQTSIPGYQILEPLGQGGMGEVLLAVEEETQRKVALKLIRQERANPLFAERFRAEYRTLARMSHPHIAQIFAAGITPAGAPFFTMELVEGQPITEYCKEHKLDVAQKIALFRQVCLGLFHAHQQAVAHRDIKPSNILVTEGEGGPVVKLIDFGIAHDLNRMDERNQPKGVMGTPAYMSPESLNEKGQGIDIRSDIYALGVVLYELLVEAHPLDPSRFNDLSWTDAIHLFASETRPIPSSRLKQLKPELQGTPYMRLLVRDLDWLVMKAMAPDIEHRYATVFDLYNDLGNFLDGRPLQARPPSSLYVADKYVRRNKGRVAALLLILLSLSGLMVGQIRSEIRLRAILQELTNYVNYLDHVLGAADPRQQGVSVRMVDVLGSFEAELPQLPEDGGKALVLRTMGKTYFGLGEYGKASEFLEKAYQLHQSILGDGNVETQESLYQWARALRRNKQYGEALTRLNNLADLQKRRDRWLWRTHYGIGLVHNERKEYEQALAFFHLALELRPKTLGFDDPAILKVRVGRGIALKQLHQYDDAERIFREVRSIQQSLLSPEHPETLATQSNLANTLIKQKKYSQAAELHREVYEVRGCQFGPAHELTLKSARNLVRALKNLDDRRDQALSLQFSLVYFHHDSPKEWVREMFSLSGFFQYSNPDLAEQMLEDILRMGDVESAYRRYALNNLADLKVEMEEFTAAQELIKTYLTYRLAYGLNTDAGEDTLVKAYGGDWQKAERVWEELHQQLRLTPRGLERTH